jgi:hypothetical protein
VAIAINPPIGTLTDQQIRDWLGMDESTKAYEAEVDRLNGDNAHDRLLEAQGRVAKIYAGLSGPMRSA